MTAQERKLAKDLADYAQVELHRHVSLNGKRYWKVKHDNRPLMCLTFTLVDKMEKRGWVKGEHSLKSLNVSSLRAAALDWQVRKDKRDNRKPRKPTSI